MSTTQMTDVVAGTVYARCDNRFWLVRLCGMLLGRQGEESDPEFAQGVALLKVDGRRFEAGQLVLDKVEEAPAVVRCEWKVGQTELHLTSAWQGDPATGVVSRQETLCNTGGRPVVLSRCLARFALPSVRYECYTQASSWCRENQGAWHPLHAGLRLSHYFGRTTRDSPPIWACAPWTGRKAWPAIYCLAETGRSGCTPTCPTQWLNWGWPTRI